MKTLYESILNSTGAGKSNFSYTNITGFIDSSNLKDIINMSKVKRVLENDYNIPYVNTKCDAQLVALLLTRFDYTNSEIDLLKKNGTEISRVFKEKLKDFLHKKNQDKFEFKTTVSSTKKTGTVHIVNTEEINWRTLFYYDLTK